MSLVFMCCPSRCARRSGLTTIGSVDVDKDGRERRQGELSKERSTKRRRNRGSVPRAEWLEANSKSRTEPWKQLGISKPTYYRWLKAGKIPNDTGPNGAKRGDILVSSDLYHDQPLDRAADSRSPQATRRQAPPDDDMIDGVVVGGGLMPPLRSTRWRMPSLN